MPDLKGYFDSIPHDRLMALVAGSISDGRVLALIESFLKQDIMKDLERWRPTAGTPQGAVISPLLANLYLHPRDLLMEQNGVQMVRYADDFVLLCRTEADAQAALRVVAAWVAGNGLTQQRANRFRRIDPLRGSIRTRRGSATAGNRGGALTSSATGSKPASALCARRA